MSNESQLEYGEVQTVLLGMPRGSQGIGFICLLTGVSLKISEHFCL